MRSFTGFFYFIVWLSLFSCTAPGDSPAEKRQGIDKMRNDTLAKLYRENTSARAIIQSAAGYAVFSNANVYVIFASIGSGYGIIVNNQSGQKTYMKMAAGGLGFGAGVKDYRLVIAFKNSVTMKKFIEEGWQFGGQYDAAVKAQEKGKALGGEIAISDMAIFEMTESGLALQITAQGTKFWKDEKLN